MVGLGFLLGSQLLLGLAAGSNCETLQPWSFAPLPLGSIKPAGWLHGEMQAMANGLAGHEHDFYVFVNKSRWLYGPGGGIDYSNLNEGLPYWFNGLVPMAYALDDSRLKTQVHNVASTVLSLQTPDGWIGPEIFVERNFWARIPFFMGLTQLAEANPIWEDPVVTGLRKFMSLTNSMLKNNSQGFTNCADDIDCRWGQARIHDMIITIQWILEKYPSDQDSLLWDNMNMFYAQDDYKWDEWYSQGIYPAIVANPDADSELFPYLHGVNVGQGLKASAVIYRFRNDEGLVTKSTDAVDWTFKYHGSPSGTILADEIEHNLAPYMGSELCTAVETAYSLAYMYQVLGNNTLADRTEVTIFNAMPVMMTGDKWAHQYMDQPNQPWAINNTQDFEDGPHVFTTANSGMATTFGMEPQYPCCTVNHPQGYPKFTSNSWVRVGENGLAHALLSPSSVDTKVAGKPVSIKCDTTYPFGGILTYKVVTEQAFNFHVRVPSWYEAQTSTLEVNGETSILSPDKNTGMHKIPLKAGESSVVFTIGASLRTENRSNNTVAVYYGNMLYALDVGFEETSSYPHAYDNPKGPGLDYLPYPELRDYYMRNGSAWNVAIDPSTLTYHKPSEDAYLSNPIFAQGAPPNYVSVQGCEIAWGLYLGTTPDVAPLQRRCIGNKREYKLIPYGAAKVHMSELPTVEL